MTYRLTFDITQLVEEIEEDEDWDGNIIENVGDEDTCCVESID
jgi:hypothetical protein